MIGVSCIFLKSFFGLCSFTAQSGLTFKVHYVRSLSGPQTGPGSADFAVETIAIPRWRHL